MLNLTRAIYNPKVPEKFLSSTKKVKEMEKQKQLKFTLDESLHRSFMAICKDLDTTASREMRRFIREYVRKHSQSKIAF